MKPSESTCRNQRKEQCFLVLKYLPLKNETASVAYRYSVDIEPVVRNKVSLISTENKLI